MKKFSWGIEKAIEYVKTRRGEVLPEKGFLR
jgi:hypothetical protein